MDNSCRSIKVLDYQGFDHIKESSDCDAYQTARRLYDDVASSVVLVETGNTASPRSPQSAHVGTGFFVNNGDEIVTNAHVAAIDNYVDVFTNDGKHYRAQIEKLSTENDLALLKVIGIEPDPKRALKPTSSDDVAKHDELVSYGHPGGSDEVVASPGVYLNRDTLEKQVGDPSRFPDLQAMIKLGKETKDPVLAREINDYLNAERLHSRMNIHHANSGSPMVNAKGELEGVVANRISAAHSLMIPGEKVKEMLENPEKRFEFEYEADAEGNQKLKAIKRLDGSDTPPVVLK